tara:strand:- start:171 stop:542 length:372 start_codon:yes stop_codon:yes gene_type:complete
MPGSIVSERSNPDPGSLCIIGWSQLIVGPDIPGVPGKTLGLGLPPGLEGPPGLETGPSSGPGGGGDGGVGENLFSGSPVPLRLVTPGWFPPAFGPGEPPIVEIVPRLLVGCPNEVGLKDAWLL